MANKTHMNFAGLLGGTVIIEQAFTLNGLGQLAITSVRQLDVPMVMAEVLFIAIMTSVINLLVDVAYAYIDPRLKMVTSGSIQFNGTNLLEINEADMLAYRGKQLSMIFQDPMTSLNPVIPVGKQVAEVLKLHNDKGLSGKEIEARVDEMFRLVGIPPERKQEYPHQFSGGMKQRVVIAISLACEPELLIADEPTTALDVTIQAQVLAMMKELKDKLGTSMIMITHDLGIVAETCDKVAVMYAGEIVESGTVEDIFNSEKHHPYTEGLFGSIPRLDVETKRLKPIDGMIADPSNLPSGCKFHPQCPYAEECCGKEAPKVWVENGHSILCRRFGREEME